MSFDPISRVRRFNRAVTSEVGALDESFLGRGRPLGAARVLNAVGHGLQDVAAVRDYLGLDSGLMSRLLRNLEDEGLIRTVPDPADARRRKVGLTQAGQVEFLAYEDLSDAQAEAILARHSDPEDLLRAMDLVVLSLKRDQIVLVESDPRHVDALYCLREYYGELASRFEKGFDVSLSRDPDVSDMIRPRGAFLVAMLDGLPLGCVGLKGHGSAIAEIKRLWVAPSARGLGLARRLMTMVESIARDLGIDLLRLDTNSALPEAAALYRKSGWRQIDRFNDDPYPDMFFEKRI
jgi:DNA-binding MarR family transcriptional regulator/GNAT superfamily N-acetyltransferase